MTLAPDQLEPELEARTRLGEPVDCPACGYRLRVWHFTEPPLVSCFNVGCAIHHASFAKTIPATRMTRRGLKAMGWKT